jgi:exopolyphosphatase/guanosine-5'-triphosphate,3'-diphosphate pyrophosphatase
LKFAAIDIGSNAIRLLVQEVFLENGRYHIEKIAYFRVPVRLGEDAFALGEIGTERQRQLVETMQAFKHLVQVYRIKNFRACATSALREAGNSAQVIELVKRASGIQIDPIAGEVEADLIFNNFLAQDIDHSGSYLYIDVGGGSTELTIIKRGERVRSISLKIGTVRALQGKVSKKQWVEARNWIREFVKGESRLTGVGTGGNINRIFKEADKSLKTQITRAEIQAYYEYISSFTYVERIVRLKMKPDRADVILPATEIFSKIMDFAEIQEMIVPKIGLSDGIILELFEDWKSLREVNV